MTTSLTDAYIARSAPFAQPILKHLRALVHEACPGVTETIKWGFPHFEYSGEILCSMAAFKKHCVFGFWKSTLLTDPHAILQKIGKTAMGSLGAIGSLNDLPSDRILKSYIKEAAKLNEKGIKAAPKEKKPKAELTIPDYFVTALQKNKKALATFEGLSPSHKREYIEWITEAKTETTRTKRMNTAIEWIAEGKGRNWKYE